MTTATETIVRAIQSEHPGALGARLAAKVTAALTDNGFRIERVERAEPRRVTPGTAVAPVPRGVTVTGALDIDGTHRWTCPEMVELARWEAERLLELVESLPADWRRVLDQTPGLSASQGERVSGSAGQSRTEREGVLRALSDTSDGPAQDFHIIVGALATIAPSIEGMTRARGRLQCAERLDGVAEVNPRSGAGPCANPNCGREVPGRGNDRRRDGRCRKCWTYRRAHHGLDRPHEECHELVVSGCDLCERRELIDAGHAPNDVVHLMDERRRASA